MSAATKAAIAFGVLGFAALTFCFVRVERTPPRRPLQSDIKLGCILGWLLWAAALCFVIAALLQFDD